MYQFWLHLSWACVGGAAQTGENWCAAGCAAAVLERELAVVNDNGTIVGWRRCGRSPIGGRRHPCWVMPVGIGTGEGRASAPIGELSERRRPCTGRQG